MVVPFTFMFRHGGTFMFSTRFAFYHYCKVVNNTMMENLEKMEKWGNRCSCSNRRVPFQFLDPLTLIYSKLSGWVCLKGKFFSSSSLTEERKNIGENGGQQFGRSRKVGVIEFLGFYFWCYISILSLALSSIIFYLY
jgi:hypothetical protein